MWFTNKIFVFKTSLEASSWLIGNPILFDKGPFRLTLGRLSSNTLQIQWVIGSFLEFQTVCLIEDLFNFLSFGKNKFQLIYYL